MSSSFDDASTFPSQRDYYEPQPQRVKPIRLDREDRTLRTVRLWLQEHKLKPVLSAYEPVGVLFLTEEGKYKPGLEVLEDFSTKNQSHPEKLVKYCFKVIARESPIYNPVLEALQALEPLPDPEHDYIKELAESISRDPLACDALRLFLREGVCAPLNGSTGNDNDLFSLPYVLLLRGVQGGGKTQFFSVMSAALAGKRYCNQLNEIPNGDKRDAMYLLLTSHIVELMEFSAKTSLRRVDEIKFLLSLKKRHYRGQFEKEAEPQPVRQIFGGTTNEQFPLTDQTGNRRFFVVDASPNFTNFVYSKRCLKLFRYAWKQALDEVRRFVREKMREGLDYMQALPLSFEPTEEQKEKFAEIAESATNTPYFSQVKDLYERRLFNVAAYGSMPEPSDDALIYDQRLEIAEEGLSSRGISAGAILNALTKHLRTDFPFLLKLDERSLRDILDRMSRAGMIKRETVQANRSIKYYAIPVNNYTAAPTTEQADKAEPQPEQPELDAELEYEPEYEPEPEPEPGSEPEPEYVIPL